MNLHETYNRIARDWHRNHSADDWWLDGTMTFVRSLPPGSLILDAGCGTGVKSKFLADHGLKVIGIDFSENMIDLARTTSPQSEFRVWDMNQAHKLPETFDGVFAQASLLHIPKRDVATVLQRLTSRLRPGGMLYIAVKERKAGKPEEEVKQERDYGYPYERFFSYFTLEEMDEYIRHGLGMRVAYESIKPSGRANWIQIIGEKHELQ